MRILYLSVCPIQGQHFIDRVPESHVSGTRQALCILNLEEALWGNSVSLQKCIHVHLTAELGYTFGKHQSKESSSTGPRISIIVKRKVLFSR